ncbi:hypothetical protein JX265_007211 [Neoarthrinium moseri]|uniref:Heterokaryon incompatibility domain-containing protein n=1 Tax=Neoarthrinium moseri TaxID=1658444 RepID=A0A9P9WKN7_9PEZI|nr:hypothetical protein JX265_007211 [Neoarthrinium moseri]
MSLCSICSPGGDAPSPPCKRNPRLCDDCQDWDDLQHVSSCLEKQQKFKPVNPLHFCYKHNRDWPPMRKAGYCDLKELDFHGGEYFASRRDNCMMCSTVGDVLENRITEDSRDSKVRLAIWKPFVFDPLDHHRSTSKDAAVSKGLLPWSQTCVLAVCMAKEDEKGDWVYQPCVIHLLLQYDQWCHGLTKVSLWQRELVDMAQVKDWLDRCVHEHGQDCNGPAMSVSASLPSSFRLVDTLDRCVVQPTSNVEYTALSYVWAAASDSLEKQELQLVRSNLELMSKPGSLNDNNIPEVVMDAIRLCQQIGKRYLWVDRFCIIQDDPESKMEQIAAMGMVYQQAFLTIVALADGPTKGLPGVDSRPRRVTLENWSWDLLATMRNPMGSARIPWIEVALERSRWNSRAWTFQERFFSGRRLYFDEGHVYGNCGTEMWHEKPEAESWKDWLDTPYGQVRTMNDQAKHISTTSFEDISVPISQYSARKLTFPSDVMNAFAGVGGLIQSQMGTKLLQGHPERYFLESLRWIPYDERATKRIVDGIPSWSWAALDGEVQWLRSWTVAKDTYLEAASGLKANILEFFYSDPDTGIRPVIEDKRALNLLQEHVKRQALVLIQKAALSWWPTSRSTDDNILDMGKEQIDILIQEVRKFAREKGWEGTEFGKAKPHDDRQGHYYDPEESTCAITALRILDQYTIPSSWWPQNSISHDDPVTVDKRHDGFEEAYATAIQCPNALLFTTTCAYLSVNPYGFAFFMIPPRRHFTGCHITTPDSKTAVGITMSMSPRFAHGNFHTHAENQKLHPVFVLGVCTATRRMQFSENSGLRGNLPVLSWDELCLLVMIGEEDKERGVMRRLAIGVVYADVWADIEKDWRSIVLV